MTQKSLVEASTRFAFKLFAELVKLEPAKNIFISPASISFALTMLYDGAGDATRQAIARTLELEALSPDEIGRASAALRQALEQIDPQITLAIANSLWVRRGMAIEPEFVQRSAELYSADVAELDFDDPGAAATINSWVSAKTGGMISEIVDEADLLSAIAVLLNAVYFKGVWTFQFDPAETAEQSFMPASGRRKQHPLMKQDGNYPYHDGEDFQAISLPYGQGRVSMDIFLPRRLSSLEDFYRGLSADNWKAWQDQLKPMDGHIALPRFKLEYKAPLDQVLRALSMAAAFDPQQASFERLSAASAWVGNIKHKARLEVNEEGTEAAAVTAILLILGSDDFTPRPFHMVVDRPFFFAIRDAQTGALLFMGSVVDPAP